MGDLRVQAQEVQLSKALCLFVSFLLLQAWGAEEENAPFIPFYKPESRP